MYRHFLFVCVLCSVMIGCSNARSSPETGGNEVDEVAKAPTGFEKLFFFQVNKPVPNQPLPTYHMLSVSGTLKTQNGCLVLENDLKTLALVLMDGTASILPGSDGVLIDGHTYRVGDKVRMGGSGGPGVATAPDAGDVLRQCVVDDVWLVSPRSLRHQ